MARHTFDKCDDGNCEQHALTVHYIHCGEAWDDTWNCACDSECPKCGADIEASVWHGVRARCTKRCKLAA